MQLSFDAADRLVELVEARRGPVPVEDAARTLFALAHAPTALARSLLDDVVAGDARLAWRGTSVGLAAPPGADVLLGDAHFVVVDLETTGLSPRTSRICEIGAQRVRALELGDTFATLGHPGRRRLADRDPAGRAPRCAARRPRGPAAARLHRRRRARRAQRALRPRLPRPRGDAPDRAADRGSGRGHGVARAAAARRADAAR